MNTIRVLLALLTLCLAAPQSTAQPAALPSEDQLLRNHGLATDGPALLEFLRHRTQTTVEREKLAALVAQLGSRDLGTSRKAAAELIALGPPALPALRQAVNNHAEGWAANWAQNCCRAIEPPEGEKLLRAVLQLVAERRPPGAVEVLLAYLPAADNELVLTQVRDTLSALAVSGDRANPILVKALEDKSSLRRAVAAEVLCGAGAARPAAGLRKLLKDPVASVRFRVALALAGEDDAEAVGVLIADLDQLPLPQAGRAEEFLIDLAAEQAPAVPLGADAASREKCRNAWAAWWHGTEGPALLDEFRKRTLTSADLLRIQQLIKDLGDDSYETREKATTALAAMDVRILPLLRKAQEASDVEVRTRVEKCVQTIEARKERLPSISPTTARLVGLRKPEGAAELLLSFLASSGAEEPARPGVQAALTAVAVRDGKPDPGLVKALDDKVAARRQAAAVALIEAGAATQVPAVRGLLQDPVAEVRLEVALALAGLERDRSAVPVLIALLKDAPARQTARAEAYLREVAGTRAPRESFGTSLEERARCHDVWEAWWREHGATATLVALPRTSLHAVLGYTLLVLRDRGQVLELDRNQKVRWEINGLSMPMDAQVLPGNRVLIAEMSASRVTERNFKGEILWQKALPAPCGCQRLPNGNTLIVASAQVLEVDREGREVFRLPAQQGIFRGAHRLRDGRLLYLTHTGLVGVVDANGNELRRFETGGRMLNYGGLDVLPNGHLLVVPFNGNKVQEFNDRGKVVWEATVPATPSAVCRLANGNVLVSSQFPVQLLEINREGKVVAIYPVGQVNVTVARLRQR